MQAMQARFGNRAVTLVFTGLPANSDPARGTTNRDVSEEITRRIKALAPGIQSHLSVSSGNQKTLTVAPIDDPAALARTVDFGKATLNGTRIEVVLAPDFVANVPRLASEPSAAPTDRAGRKGDEGISNDGDPVARSLVQLQIPNTGSKKEAVERLGRTAPDGRLDEVVQALLPLLNDDDGFLVNDVIKTLAVWRSPDALSALIERARDNRFFVRKEAVKTLGKFNDPRAIEAIIACFKEDGFEAEAALKEIGPPAEPALIARLSDPDPDIRRKVCDVLRQIGGIETLNTMKKMRPDPEFSVQVAARRACEQIATRVGPRSSKAGGGSKNKAR
jgi:hypothetical protein